MSNRLLTFSNYFRFYNFRALTDRGNKYQFLFEDDESHTLIVNNLGLLDSGEYSVSASNKLGKAESSYKLKSGQSAKCAVKQQIQSSWLKMQLVTSFW